MTTKRATIGRTFHQSSLKDATNEDNFSQRFILASGQSALFRLERVEAVDLNDVTFVTLAMNGRDQSALTKESLVDITRTIKLQQFFPAVGQKVGDRIEILDGSRRRAGALIANVGLNILVTDAEISVTDARQLAADIQTAKEHNLREIGLRLLLLRESGMNQKEIAESQKLSAAKVTRAIQAASVPDQMLSMFPVQSELTYPDYKFLLNLTSQLTSEGIHLTELIDQVIEDKKHIVDFDALASDEVKNEIMQIFRKSVTNLLSDSKEAKSITIALWEFANKDKFARKKIKGRLFSYEFSRLPRELQDDLDQTINNVIRKHFSR